MEDQAQDTTFQETPVNPTPTPQAQVRYPVGQVKPKGKKNFAVVLMVLSLVLIGGGIFYFLGQRASSSSEPSPTPEEIFGVTTIQEESQPTTTPSPKAVDKEGVSIQILNGTGIPKEASYLQGLLEGLGYTKIETGNSENQDYEDTEVIFSKSLDSAVVSEITAQLEKTYQNVKTSTSSSLSVDVKIITGLKKGATPKGSAAATATPKATTSPTSTPTPTPTSTASE